MRAIIKTDPHKLDANLNQLVEEMFKYGIEPVFLRGNNLGGLLDKCDKSPILLFDQDEVALTYANTPAYRMLKNFFAQDSGVSGIIDKNKNIMGFYPDRVQRIVGSNIYLKDYCMVASNIVKIHKEADIELPRIIINGYQRKDYYRLTLNSILNSISGTKKPPITIVLNSTDSEIRDLSFKFVENYTGSADILSVKPNSLWAWSLIAMIWHRPKKVIICEDDFILPEVSARSYPNWPLQFAEKLEFFDVVSWSSSCDNYPYREMPETWATGQVDLMKARILGEKWQYNGNALLMAQICAFSVPYYFSIAKRLNCIPMDHHLYQYAGRGYCCPTMQGYHIGWNQKQDGYGSLNQRSWGDFGWSNEYEVTNLIDGTQRTINPKRFISDL
jgi:hypothetical protein